MARKNNLTDKQSRFVDEYLVDLNATQAAIRAGYSKKTAYSIGQENLKKPEIQQAISEVQQSRSERTQITQDKVLKDLSELLDICKGRKQVLTTLTVKNTQEGIINTIETPTYTFDPSGANKALELMGKHLGMFRDKVDVSGDIVTHDITLTSVEFERIATKLLNDV